MRVQRIGALAALGAAVAAGNAGAGSLARERYIVDPARSRITVETRTTGLSSMFGHDHTFDVRSLAGDASFVPGAPETGEIELTVQADSLWLMEDVGDTALLSVDRALKQQVLESPRYPRIVFRARAVAATALDDGVFEVRLAGELGLRGVRRRLIVPVRVFFEAGRLRAMGAVEIRQTDFKIVPFVFAGGTVKVRDRVRVSFDIVASRIP